MTAGGTAFGHDTEILHCSKNLTVERVTKLGEVINPNGTLSEAYDRNDDEKIDIEAISYIHSTKLENGVVILDHDAHPFLYIVDLDFDGRPDAVYVDKSGVGKCEDIVLYKDLTKPHQENKDEKPEGRL